MGAAGIAALQAVCAQKSDIANQDALAGANKQSKLVEKEEVINGQLDAAETAKDGTTLAYDSSSTGGTGYLQLHNMLEADIGDGATGLGGALNDVNYNNSGLLGTFGTAGDNSTWTAKVDSTKQDQTGGANYDKLNDIYTALNNYSQTLQAQDRLGNTQIQTLMSNYNESETTLSSVDKTAHDTATTVIGKM